MATQRRLKRAVAKRKCTYNIASDEACTYAYLNVVSRNWFLSAVMRNKEHRHLISQLISTTFSTKYISCLVSQLSFFLTCSHHLHILL